MNRIITKQDGVVTATQGNISVEINGQAQLLAQGQTVPRGSIISFEDGMDFQLELADDSTQNQVNQIIDEAALAEIEALQDVIASGEDPTEDLPETAAGGQQGNQGGSDFATLERSANETLADTEFDTRGLDVIIADQQTEETFVNDFESQLLNDLNTITEDTIATGNVLTNDSDADSSLFIVSYRINGQTADAGESMTVRGGTLVINSDGGYSFAPAADWSGALPAVTYTTNTGSTATLTIEVTPADDPSALQNDSGTVNEDEVAAGNVLANDNDIDDTLSVINFSVNGQTADAGESLTVRGGTLVINSDGGYSFAPAADWSGALPAVTYTTNTGSTATLTIEVTPADDPSALQNDSGTANEDEVAAGNVLANDNDIDDTLSVTNFSVNGQSADAGESLTVQGGTLVINSDGSYSFTPAANWSGALPAVTYTTNTGSTATLTIEVTPADDPSALQNDSGTVNEDEVAAGNVLANDNDIDDTLSVINFSVNGQTADAGESLTVQGGTLVINSDGGYSFAPAADWSGALPAVTYTTNTGSTATLTIEVTPADDPSALRDDSGTVNEDEVAAGNVLANDNDIDDTLSVINFSVNGQSADAGESLTVQGGTLVINSDGGYSFAPAADWSGALPAVTYTTNTGSTATLSIDVTPLNDAPTITVAAENFTENSAAAGQVAARYGTRDEDGDRVTVSWDGAVPSNSASEPLYVLNDDGTVTLTRAGAEWVNGGNPLPVIKLSVSDGSETGKGEDIPEVDLVNDIPVATDDTFESELGQVLTGNLILENNGFGADSDEDSNTLFISTINGQSVTFVNGQAAVDIDGGTLLINRDGSFEFQHSDAQPQVVRFTYSITDGSSVSEQAAVEINIKDTTPPTSPAVRILDDLNDDGVLTQAEMEDDGVQISVTIAHDEFISGGHVNIILVLQNTDGDRPETSYTASFEDGNFVVRDAADNVIDGFSYDAATGTISWSEPEPGQGESIRVKADQVDAAGNHSDSPTDSAVVLEPPVLNISSAGVIASLDFENVTLNGSYRTNVITSDLSAVGVWGTHNTEGHLEVGRAEFYGAQGGSNQVLELEAEGSDHTLFVDLTLEKGTLYQFDFDAAARNEAINGVPVEVSSDFTVKLINIDTSEEILLHDVDFSDGGIWQHIDSTLSVEATGNYRIIFEAKSADSYGALIDNISFKSLDNQGYEDTAVKLSKINVSSFTESAVDISTSLKLSGIPGRSVVTGTDQEGNSISAVADSNGEIVLASHWDYGSLYIQIESPAIYTLMIEAITQHANGNRSSVTDEIELVILPTGYDINQLDASTANIITDVEGATVEIPEAWLLYSDVRPEHSELMRVTGATHENGSLSIIAENNADFSYAITDGKGVSETHVAVNIDGSGSRTLAGGIDNNIIISKNASTIVFHGYDGDDVIAGNDGFNIIYGGAGNDLLIGGNGDDYLYGDTGSGDDSGSDTFLWQQGETGLDTIYGFDKNQDILDLSDLLQGEDINNLDNYLDFKFENGSTLIEIDIDGDGSGPDQTIVLNGVDLKLNNSLSDEQVIQNLLNDDGHTVLIVDTDSAPIHSQAVDTQPHEDETFFSGNIIP